MLTGPGLWKFNEINQKVDVDVQRLSLHEMLKWV